jgi:integrase
VLRDPFTVNDTIEQLKKLFTRAKAWGVRFYHEPAWRDHWLGEPQERVRELRADEGDRLDAAVRDGLAPFFAFVKTSGLRRKECLSLRWSEIDWSTKRISRAGRSADYRASHDPMAAPRSSPRNGVHLRCADHARRPREGQALGRIASQKQQWAG